MATFAEYPAQTMASNDFTLYPYQDVWNQDQSYLSATSYSEQPYLQATTFDSYKPQAAYAQHNPYPFNNLHALSPNYSPAHSATHSFDLHNPPVLSSTSDSGASVQSTISSTMASPSVQPQHVGDWNQRQTMLPEIVQPDLIGHDVFTTTGFDMESIPVTDKSCVGELTAISSISQLQRNASPAISYPDSPEAQALFYTWYFPPNAPNATFDPHSPALQATTIPHAQDCSSESVSPNDSLFRSPSTPASALSPMLERVKGKRKASGTSPSPKRKRTTSSPLTQTMSYPESDLPARPQAPTPTMKSPFFSQSSGHFVPPLDYSYPSLIQPTFSPSTQFTGTQFTGIPAVQSPQNMGFTQLPSPAAPTSPQQTSIKAARSASPYAHPQPYQPYPTHNGSRRQSMSSIHSRHSQGSLSSEDSNKGLCPIPTCGRHVKDLKAHMLTHQNERPEKCPIPTCEYHTKGFARKYDKNRHTLTHYKGTMVCGFCPGSGSAAEKSFNRADVFKRHLTSVHNVEQTPPNARRKSPSTLANKRSMGREASGMCSTCGNTFASPQDFYEHLDDCVLRVVQLADPSEAINEKLLSSMVGDDQVKETMEKHMLPSGLDYNGPTSFDEEEEADDDEDAEDEDTKDGTFGSRSAKSGKGALKSRKAGDTNPS